MSVDEFGEGAVGHTDTRPDKPGATNINVPLKPGGLPASPPLSATTQKQLPYLSAKEAGDGGMKENYKEFIVPKSADIELDAENCKVVDDQELEHEGSELQESIWDAALLVGVHDMSALCTVWTVVLVLFNVVVQVMFIYIVLLDLMPRNLSEATVKGYRAWRTNIAHMSKHQDPISLQSLAAQVCEQNVGLQYGSQVDAFSAVMNYADRGPLLATLCCFMWLVTVINEASSALALLTGTIWLRAGVSKSSNQISNINVWVVSSEDRDRRVWRLTQDQGFIEHACGLVQPGGDGPASYRSGSCCWWRRFYFGHGRPGEHAVQCLGTGGD